MTAKEPRLGLYIVFSREPGTITDIAELVIAESADKAADTVAFAPNRSYRSVREDDGVGRLGDYEPGITGHSLVIEAITRGSHNGAIILAQPMGHQHVWQSGADDGATEECAICGTHR